MRESLQISALEHYTMLVNWIRTLPMYGSLEAALSLTNIEPGNRLMFCVHRNGAFDIYRAWRTDQVVSQRDFTILLIDLNLWRERAIQELGAQQLDQLNLDHLNIVCNGNIKLVDSVLTDTKVNFSNTTDTKDGSSSQ